MVKLKFDAAYDQDTMQSVVLQFLGCNQRIIRRRGYNFEWGTDVLTAAIGVSLAQTVGCNRVVVNFDNQDAIQIMQGGEQCLRLAVVVLNDCYYMAFDFPRILFKHCYREANGVPHELVIINHTHTCLKIS